MKFRINARESRTQQMSAIESADAALRNDDSAAVEESELRRLMYERIAQGNAVTEAEENAHRKWRGK